MPSIDTTGVGTVYIPTPYEIEENNKRKRMKREHQQLLDDVAELKATLSDERAIRAKVIRRRYY